jgi:outer membrane protein TolC
LDERLDRLGSAIVAALTNQMEGNAGDLAEEQAARQQAETRLRKAEARLTDLETELAEVCGGKNTLCSSTPPHFPT